MALVKTLSDDTDRKVGEAAAAVARFFITATTLLENINLIVVRLKDAPVAKEDRR